MAYQEGTNRDQTVAATRDSKQGTCLMSETLDREDTRLLLQLASTCGFDAVLSGPDLLTFFAPVGEAFRRLPSFADLTSEENRLRLYNIFESLTVRGSFTQTDLKMSSMIRTRSGATYPIRWENKMATIGGARVVQPDIACINGTIHKIDSLPEALVKAA